MQLEGLQTTKNSFRGFFQRLKIQSILFGFKRIHFFRIISNGCTLLVEVKAILNGLRNASFSWSLKYRFHIKPYFFVLYCACRNLGIPKAEKVEQKEEVKKILKWGKILFWCSLRWQNFRIPEKWDVVNLNSQQKI